IRGDTASVGSLTFLPDSKTLAVNSLGAIKLWDLPTGQERATLKHPGGAVAAISADGRIMATGDRNGTVKFWRTATEQDVLAQSSATSSRYFLERALTHQRTGSYREAASDYDKALQLDPDSGLVHNNLAWFLATCPDANFCDPGRALTLAKKAVELAPQ